MIAQEYSIDDLIELIDSINPNIISLIIFLLFLFILWLIGRILKFIIKKMKRIPVDAKNGIRNIVSIFQVLFIFFGFAFILEVDPDLIISTSTLVATAIGFASTSIAANLVGGLYLIITQPFGVGDFITVQGKEGVVLEVGLLYSDLMLLDRTVVTIPNSTLMNADLLNSTIPFPEEDISTVKSKGQKKQLTYNISEVLSQAIEATFYGKEIVKFTTKIELNFDAVTPKLNMEELQKRLDLSLKDTSSLFGFPVEYYLGNYIYRQEVFLIITSNDSNNIIENYHILLENIIDGVFPELKEGQA